VFERIASGVQDYGPSNLAVPDLEVVDDHGTSMKQPWAAEVTSYIRERKDELAGLRHETAGFVRWRRLHYNAMLFTTLAVAAGVIDLRFRVRARLANLLGHDLAGGSGVASAQAPSSPPDAVSSVISQGVRFTSDLSTLILPEGSHSVVAPAFEYLAAHPARFAITFAAITILVWLRATLREKTDRKHVAFWEALRAKLRTGGQGSTVHDASGEKTLR